MDAWMAAMSDRLFAMDINPWAYPLVFLAGLLTNLCGCNVAMVPLVIGCVGGFSRSKERFRAFLYSVVFATGTALTFVVLGLLAALAGAVLVPVRPYVMSALALISVLMGLVCLKVIRIRLPGLENPQVRTAHLKGLGGTFLLGMLGGIVASPCTTPVLATILVYVAASARLVYGISLLVTYALGYVIPLLLAGIFSDFLLNLGKLQHRTGYQTWVARISGVLLLGFAGYILIVGWS